MRLDAKFRDPVSTVVQLPASYLVVKLGRDVLSHYHEGHPQAGFMGWVAGGLGCSVQGCRVQGQGFLGLGPT